MTGKDKQRIARLVAEKVWLSYVPQQDQPGLFWIRPPRWDKYYNIEQLTDMVFSWAGFGQTVEVMLVEFKINIHEFDIPKSFGVQFTQREGAASGYFNAAYEDGIILTTHLAALNALGIDWRKDND